MRYRVYNPPSPSPSSAGKFDGKIHLIKKNQSQLQRNHTNLPSIRTAGCSVKKYNIALYAI